jgi:hypothetical protein
VAERAALVVTLAAALRVSVHQAQAHMLTACVSEEERRMLMALGLEGGVTLWVEAW